ncbi:MAG: hypothetical protein JWN98_1823 [Abditibacteriota bacterium]|nr:hypothetical protein [Abditibacteriota bacterium]
MMGWRKIRFTGIGRCDGRTDLYDVRAGPNSKLSHIANFYMPEPDMSLVVPGGVS